MGAGGAGVWALRRLPWVKLGHKKVFGGLARSRGLTRWSSSVPSSDCVSFRAASAGAEPGGRGPRWAGLPEISQGWTPCTQKAGDGCCISPRPPPQGSPLLQSSPCPPPGPPSSSAHRGSGPGCRRLGWSWEEMGVLGADGAAGSWEPGVFGAGVTCSAGLCPRALGLQPLQEVGGQHCPGWCQRAHLSLGLLCPLLHGAPGQEGNPDSFLHVGVSVSGHETRETPCMSACDLTLRVFVPDFQT